MSLGMTLFDQRVSRFRTLDDEDHREIEDRTRELIEQKLEKYTQEICVKVRVFVAWLSGIKRDEPGSQTEADILRDMVTLRKCAILPSNMEALRVYADLARIGAEVASAPIKIFEEHTNIPFKIISNTKYTAAVGKRSESRRAVALRRVV